MRVLVRRELDITKPVDLSQCTWKEQLSAGFRSWLSGTEFYQRKQNQIHEKEHKERISQIENLKEVILSLLYEELVNNRSVSKRKEESETICISIERQYEKYIEETLNSSDFDSYIIDKVEEDFDVMLSFPDLPMLFEVSLKRGDNSNEE